MRSQSPRCAVDAIRRWLCGASQHWPQPGLALEKRKAGEKRTPGGKLQPASLESKMLRYRELGSHSFPNLDGAFGKEGKKSGFPRPLHSGHKALCCVGKEAQGYATLALPSVTLMSGSGDRAARGLLRVLWQDCCGSRWGRKLISRPEVWGGRPEVWGGRYGGRGAREVTSRATDKCGISTILFCLQRSRIIGITISKKQHRQSPAASTARRHWWLKRTNGGGHCAQGTRMGRSNGRAS